MAEVDTSAVGTTTDFVFFNNKNEIIEINGSTDIREAIYRYISTKVKFYRFRVDESFWGGLRSAGRLDSLNTTEYITLVNALFIGDSDKIVKIISGHKTEFEI